MPRPDACWYASHNTELNDGEPERTVNLNGDYIAIHLSIVRKRIKQAGIRLGALLNELLG